jgi:trimeric autotransporter adhesin
VKGCAIAAFLLAAGCVPHLSGAPCRTDDNCPGTQYCDGTACQVGTPPSTRVVQLLVTADAGILPLGSTVQATATAVLQSGAQQDVTAQATWMSSDSRVAQVSSDAGTEGEVLGVATGEVDVSATLANTSASVHLIVTDAELVSLVVTVDRPVVAPRTDVVCTAMGFFTDGTHADLSSLASWTSSQPEVVSVSNAAGSVGSLVALTTGSTQLGASYQKLSGSTNLTITSANLTGVVISPLLPWVTPGTSAALVATGLFSDGSAQPMTGSVQWTVDDPSIAFFLSSLPGELEGFAPGTTQVEAQAGPLVGQVPLLVSAAPLDALEVSPALPDYLGVGGEASFTAFGTFADQGVLELTAQSLWASTAPDVVAVPPGSGEASALDAGVSSVQASFGGLTASAVQSVDAAPQTALLLWPPSAAVTVGLPGALTAERVLSDGSVDDATQLAGWTSSCPVDLEVATGQRGGALASRAPRTCTARAAFGGLYGSTSVVATSRTLQRLEVSPSQVSIGPGGWAALSATAVFADGSFQDVTSLAAWNSTGAGVVVAGNGPEAGQALAADAGVTQLSASFAGATASADVTVLPQPPVLEVWPPTALLHVGMRRGLTATAVWPTGDAVDVTAWTAFFSSNPSVVGVANASGHRGSLGAFAAGTAQVAALFGSASASASVEVTAATPNGVTVIGPSALPVGELGALQATAHFSDGSAADVTSQAAWTSSAPDLLRVRGTGPLRGAAMGVGTGSPSAQARFAAVSGSAELPTSAGGLVSLAISGLASGLPVAVRVQLTATATYPGGTQLDVTSRTLWTSRSPATVSVSNGPAAGVLVGHLPGSAEVTATFEGSVTTASVMVSSATLTGLAIQPAGPTGAVGVEVPLHAQGEFTDGSLFDVTAQARWSTASPAAVAVSNGPQSRGVAMALLAASSTIFASFLRPDTTVATGSTTFVGNPAIPVGVEILPPSIALSLSTGPSITLRASARFSDGSSRDVSAQVSWSVENPAVAEVTPSGQLSAQTSGNTLVLATLGSLSGSAPLQVTP